MEFTAENMRDMLGAEGGNCDAELFSDYLIRNGWTLAAGEDGQVRATKNGEEMTETEWLDALAGCFG